MQLPMCRVKILTLHHNNIGDDGLTAIAHALRANNRSHLEELDLRENTVDRDWADDPTKSPAATALTHMAQVSFAVHSLPIPCDACWQVNHSLQQLHFLQYDLSHTTLNAMRLLNQFGLARTAQS